VAACRKTDDGWDVWWRSVHQAGQQLSLLAPLLAELLAHEPLKGLTWHRIGVTRGPGTFTGLRIGLATARTLAQVWSADMVAVDTLDVVACNAWTVFPSNSMVEYRTLGRPSRGDMAVVLDARKGELFAASYPAGGDWPHPSWGPIAVKPDALEPGHALAGSGLKRYPELAGVARPEPEWWPSAAHVALAAAGAWPGAPAPQPWSAVEAFYLRAPDAEVPAFMRKP
jgi:tRNA threonylcarbamoyladenosine biosynthesis protein TsaB